MITVPRQLVIHQKNLSSQSTVGRKDENILFYLPKAGIRQEDTDNIAANTSLTNLEYRITHSSALLFKTDAMKGKDSKKSYENDHIKTDKEETEVSKHLYFLIFWQLLR